MLRSNVSSIATQGQWEKDAISQAGIAGELGLKELQQNSEYHHIYLAI